MNDTSEERLYSPSRNEHYREFKAVSECLDSRIPNRMQAQLQVPIASRWRDKPGRLSFKCGEVIAD